MGGTVSVIIKNKDKIDKLAAWTNPVPYFINNEKFFEKDQSYLQEYINKQEDLLSNIYPVEYGLIYIDYDANVVLSAQGYSSLGKMNLVTLLNDSEQASSSSKIDEDFESLLKIQPRFKTIWFNDKISKHDYLKYSTNLKEDLNKINKSLKNSSVNNVETFASIIELETYPFTFKRFEDSAKGFIELKEELGNYVRLSDEEIKLWQEFIQERVNNGD